MNKHSDLHLHSTASDGGYSPTELMRKCKAVNLEIVALTDHDSVDGVKEAQIEANKLDMTCIAGIELSTIHKGKSVHILGYDFQIDNEALIKMLHEQKVERVERLYKMVEKLHNLHLKVDADQILREADGGAIGRPHVAKALIAKGYVKTVKEAFSLYLSEGRPAYVRKSKELSVEEAIHIIHQAGGVAIVAHPVYYKMDDEIRKWIRDFGLDGIEVYHRDHDEQVQAHYYDLCERFDEEFHLNLYRTGGSDFHHENYGRVLQPLGVTRIDNELASRIVKRHS